MTWEYTSENVAPGESWYVVLRRMGDQRWEAWHIEKNDGGWREIYFKRASGLDDVPRNRNRDGLMLTDMMTGQQYPAPPSLLP